jgi:AcrR family transcriptional regulator
MRRTSAETREHVLGVASALFYKNGIRATGVDEIAAAAEVAPTTLYRAFGSKDELVATYVENSDERNRAWIDHAINAAGTDPRAQIIAVFRELSRQVRSPDFRGCACMMTLAEYPDAAGPALRAVAAKQWIGHRLGQLAEDFAVQVGKPVDAAALGDELMLVFEGTQATASSLGARGPSSHATALVERILDSHTGA